MKRLTTAQAAKLRGIGRKSVSNAATKHKIGELVNGGYLFTQAEWRRLSKLIPGKVGNPNMGKNFHKSKLSKKGK